MTVYNWKKELIALLDKGHNKGSAAKALEISRNHVYRLLKV